jgi:hypothetical protein
MEEKTNKEKDLESLEEIMKFSLELEEAIIRYNARHTEMDALYNIEHIIVSIWIIAHDIRDRIEKT